MIGLGTLEMVFIVATLVFMIGLVRRIFRH
jgi:hypothetical protein